ncbi:MAG: Crp/Fnr family transcriptional regulator [Campylobacterota bacterium]
MIKDILKNITLFHRCNDAQLGAIAQITSLQSFESDTILHYEAENTNKLLFLVDGLLKVYKIDKYDNEIFLYHVYKNTMISELSSLSNNEIRCFSNAEFVQKSRILSVDFKQFKEILHQSSALAFEFASLLIDKNHQLQCIINRELVFDATSKVAFMLYNDLEMFNELKRTEAAFLLHIQPETLSRVLKRLSRNGIITIEKGQIIINDDDSLQAIFMDVG